MKILFVCSGNSIVHIAPFIRSQAESLKKKKVEVDFYTVKGKGLWGYIKNILPLRKFLRKNRYDLIHAHYALTGWVSILANMGKLPVIVSYMGCDVYGDYNKNGKRIISSYINIWSAKLLQPLVDRVIVKSANLEKYIYMKRKCSIIPNGVDMGVFKPVSKEKSRLLLDLPLNTRYALFLANPHDPRKNYVLFQRALSSEILSEIQPLTPYPIDHTQIPHYLNAADLFVLCSFNEGSPNVIKEAMACNCPIVSTDVGDVREVIGKTEGCFISSFDPNDFAEKIKSALDFDKRTTGRTDIAHLEEGIIADKIINLYHEVLEKK